MNSMLPRRFLARPRGENRGWYCWSCSWQPM